jgi:hypothetical protein
LGALAIGWLSDYIGLRWPVFIAGLICFALWLWVLPRRRGMAEALEAGAQEEAKR